MDCLFNIDPRGNSYKVLQLAYPAEIREDKNGQTNIPKAFRGLGREKYIDGHLDLNQLHEYLGFWKYTTHIHIANMSVEDERVIEQLEEMPLLMSLSLYDPELKTFSPLKRLKHLSSLSFKNCNALPLNLEGIGQLINLKTLKFSASYLSHFNVSDLPNEIYGLTSLTCLKIYSNASVKFSPEFMKLSNLWHLQFKSQDGEPLPLEIFNMTMLTRLNMSQNVPQSPFPTQIRQLKLLTFLDLSFNKLNNLPDEICDLSYLTDLNICSNGLTALPAKISQLKNLRYLNLYHNKLNPLPIEICDLTNLIDLNICSNGLIVLPSVFIQLEKLESLVLSLNKLNIFPSQILALTNLKNLNFQQNTLQALPTHISRLKNLCAIDFRSNNLSSLPKEIGDLTNLMDLHVANNHLLSLPDQIGKLKHLRHLSAYENPLIALLLTLQKLKNSLIYLDVDFEKIPLEQVNALKELMPELKRKYYGY